MATSPSTAGGDGATRDVLLRGSIDTRRLLYRPEDRDALSALSCLVRQNVEAFVATADDVQFRYLRGGRNAHILDVGSVGIRCVHCAPPQDGIEHRQAAAVVAAERNIGRSAVLYPRSIRLVYQAVRNFQRHHLLVCAAIPEEVKSKYLELKRGKEQGKKHAVTRAEYWEQCCQRMGMTDTAKGIRLRTGHFVDDGEVTGICNGATTVFDRDIFPEKQASVSDIETSINNSKPASPLPITELCANTMATGFDPDVTSQNSVPDENERDFVKHSFCKNPLHLEASAKLGDILPSSAVSSTEMLSRESVLDRVKLAHSTVQAMGEMRQLPAHGDDDAFGKEPSGDSISGSCQSEELRFLGVELYELFSGLSWGISSENTELASNDSSLSDESTLVQQRKKREKRPEGDGTTKAVRLSEMGFPTSISILVSSLLSNENDSCGGGVYRSVDEVEEDLLVMIRFPEKYLYDASLSGIELTRIDISDDALYGRNEQTTMLLQAYERTVCSTSQDKNEVVFIAGYSGTGKSSIVRKVQGHYVQKGACFVSGKFDAMHQLQPFSALVTALNQYCDLLVQDTSRIKHVREVVSAAIGSEGRFLLDLIPSLRKILPYDADEHHFTAHALLPDADHRLSFLIRTLFRLTCSKSNPVVLFLDDLQWADASSLELIRTLVTDPQLFLLFIGCYRDNEVGSDHPLMAHMNSLRNSGSANITTISINNMDTNSINSLVADALHMLPRQTFELANVVEEKTGGNALFVVQFLASLCEGGHLRFSLATRRWDWDIDRIRDQNIADNVVEFMILKLLRLAPEVIEALKLAAAFGAHCHEDLVQILDRNPACLSSTSAALDMAVTEGLMAKVGGPSYRFSHDQIQSAAYQLIDESDREGFHLNIGRCLCQYSSCEEMDSYLFVVVDQFHRGSSLITECHEKANVARLSLLAGQKASAMSAFLSALAFLKGGITMLSDDDWEGQNRDLCFDIFNMCAEVEYILGDFDDMRGHLEQVLGRAKMLDEKLRASFILVQSLGTQLLMSDAINTASEILAHLGETFPSALSEATVKQEIMKTQTMLYKKTEEDLIDKKSMPVGEKKEAMKFFNLVLMYTYVGKVEHFAWVACRMLQLSLSHGVCGESAYAFAVYGMMVCGIIGDYSGGHRLGKLALSLLERFNAKESHARVICVIYGFINPWIEPLQAALQPLREAVDVGLSTGDTEFAMFNAQVYHGTALASGKALSPLMDEMRVYSQQMVELKQALVYTVNTPLRQATLNLLGRSADPIQLVGEEMDEESLLKNAENGGNRALISIVFFYRMWLEYLFGEYERAADTAKKNSDVAKHNMCRFAIICNHAFYSGLAALALERKERQGKWVDMIDNAIAQMELWAFSSRWNCQHKLDLMKAEYLCLLGDFAGAAKAYDLAVNLAANHHFVHEEALSLERSGIFYLESGDHNTASTLFVQACSRYEQWGACSKAAQIRELYL